MEPNQATIPSPDNSWIPQGIPTGVFVPNNQPVPNTVQQAEPVAAVPTAPVVDSSVAPVTPAAPVVSGPGTLDKIFTGIARFFAKIMGQPDPITGKPNTPSQAVSQAENIVGKVWGAANQVVDTASNVAGQAVNTVNQATQQIQQVIPQPQAPAAPVSPVVEQPVQPQAPAAPVQ